MGAQSRKLSLQARSQFGADEISILFLDSRIRATSVWPMNGPELDMIVGLLGLNNGV